MQEPSMEPELPKLGDIAFAQTWRGIECQAVVDAVEAGECYAQLRLIEEGKLLWSSPKVESHEDDMAFGAWNDGSGAPCLFDDIDGDGRPEVLAYFPKGDLTPTVYRVFRWDGQQLRLVKKSSLVRNESGAFVWTEVDLEDTSPMAWIDYFDQGLAQVVHRRRATFSHSSLLLKPNAAGFAEAL